jgi:hypothetical protein
MRRIGIVAVNRRLLIDLWRFLEYGVIPEGAVLITYKHLSSDEDGLVGEAARISAWYPWSQRFQRVGAS